MNQWWITFVEQHLLRRMAEALRQALDLPGVDEQPIGAREIELYWLFHGGIFYYGQRREVYGHKSQVALAAFIETSVDALLNSAPMTVRALLPKKAARVDRRRVKTESSFDKQ